MSIILLKKSAFSSSFLGIHCISSFMLLAAHKLKIFIAIICKSCLMLPTWTILQAACIFSLRTLDDKYVKHVPKGKLNTCFIDFKKAFDSVWHDGLFYKLLQYNIGGKFYDLIKNLYSKTKCSIKVSDQTTEFFDYCN